MSVQLTGATLEIDYKGTKLTFHALRDCDFGEFEMWAQDRYLSVIKRNITDLPEAQQSLILMDAFNRAALMTFSSKEVGELMKSIEGSSRLLHLSLRKSMTLDEVRILSVDKSFVLAALEKIQLLSGPPEIKTNTETLSKKKSKLRRGKKSINTSQKPMGGLPNK